MEVLVTGCAGFIGSHVTKRLLEDGHHVVGIDNLNNYYDVQLKHDRLAWIQHPNLSFYKLDITDRQQLITLFAEHSFDRVIHLAAQAGVRYSIDFPETYVETNVGGFFQLLECCRQFKTPHLLYASSSSVYGGNQKSPFSVDDPVEHPMSLYAATKKSNELFAHSYSNLYQLPTTGLRFFTVYGPWGRPDMALFKFTKNILNNQEIDVYNNGHMLRDFTYVSDIVESVVQLMDQIPTANVGWSEEKDSLAESFAPYRVLNIGHSEPVKLMDFIETLEQELAIEAKKNFMPLQKGDVPDTFADVSALRQLIGYQPETTIVEGIRNFVAWYKQYYGVKEVLHEKL
ncbi:NAD-dependent epimerase [Kurthia massiliensis]|uniref:NAD-dependent epimerase n=1 Tax=Kurthia massiliensis TaxID=1033739 RepID=UPI00028A2D12|nr:NAD-dependent epimerase [Kurthia massiliensis]